jgi:hypothetical protein
MPTLIRDRKSDIQLPELTRSDVKLKDVELPKFDLSKVDLSKLELPKVEIPRLERPTPDEVGKAVAGVAATIGIAKARPRRWPYIVAAGLVVAAAGWVAMNWSTIRARFDRVAAKAGERMATVQGEDTWDDAVAFTAAETMPIEPSLDTAAPANPTLDDYPNGLGVHPETVGSTKR